MQSQIPFFTKSFLPIIKSNSIDSERYKFLIYENGNILPKFSTHKITLNINNEDRECFFAITNNDWVYLFTEDIYVEKFDGWHGDHFTLGYFTESEINNKPELDNFIRLHKTSYKEESGKYLKTAVYCDFNRLHYINKTSDPACFFTKDTIANLSRNFNFTFKKESQETKDLIRVFLQLGLEVYSGGSYTIKYKNKIRKIYTGKRDGKYIIVNKKKIYISKQKGGGSANFLTDDGIKQLVTSGIDFTYDRAKIFIDNSMKSIKIIYESDATNTVIVKNYMYPTTELENMQNQIPSPMSIPLAVRGGKSKK